MIHELKCWPGPFQVLVSGLKTHEIRRADRPFAVDDLLYLREWSQDRECYTGRTALVHVTYLTSPGEWGLPADICVMSVRVVSVAL